MNWISSLQNIFPDPDPKRDQEHTLEEVLAALYDETMAQQDQGQPCLDRYESYSAICNLALGQQRRLVCLLLEKIVSFEQRRRRLHGEHYRWDQDAQINFINEILLRRLMRCSLQFSEAEFRQLFERYLALQELQFPYSPLPVVFLLHQMECTLTGCEEDAYLSLLLSKAFLFSADDQISDPAILRQIR